MLAGLRGSGEVRPGANARPSWSPVGRCLWSTTARATAPSAETVIVGLPLAGIAAYGAERVDGPDACAYVYSSTAAVRLPCLVEDEGPRPAKKLDRFEELTAWWHVLSLENTVLPAHRITGEKKCAYRNHRNHPRRFAGLAAAGLRRRRGCLSRKTRRLIAANHGASSSAEPPTGLLRQYPPTTIELGSPASPEEAELGRLLFFDPLSEADDIACASCHPDLLQRDGGRRPWVLTGVDLPQHPGPVERVLRRACSGRPRRVAGGEALEAADPRRRDGRGDDGDHGAGGGDPRRRRYV